MYHPLDPILIELNPVHISAVHVYKTLLEASSLYDYFFVTEHLILSFQTKFFYASHILLMLVLQYNPNLFSSA